MKLILINGLPATGKTSLGEKISEELRIPFFGKDAFKEIIFDYIGGKNEIGKVKISKSGYALFYYVIEQNLKVGNTIIAESNFIPEFSNQVFINFQEKYDFDIIQIFCKTDGKVLFERFKQRSFGKNRHPGHDDKNNIEVWKDVMIKGKLEPLNLSGKLIRLDTTNFEKIDYNSLYEEIENFLENGN